MPDLAVASITVPSSASVGGIAQVSWTAGNYGTASVGAVTWYDRIVLSQDNIYGDGDDIQLWQNPRSGPLNVGDTYS